MFKGFKKEFQEQLEKNNQESDKFFFSFGDLELVEINDKRRKCRLISEELSNKLYQIYSSGKNCYIPPIKFIDFEFSTDYGCNDSVFLNSDGRLTYKYWLEVNKEILKTQKISSDGTLFISSNLISTRPIINISDYIGSIEKYHQKAEKTISTRRLALTQINDTIQNGNLDLTTLAESMLFLGESYISARPTNCLHCDKELEENPESIADYYQTHINKCIWRPDRINRLQR